MKIRSAISLFCLVSVFACGDPRRSVGELIEVAADPGRGFNYPYFLTVPHANQASRLPWLVVESNNTGTVSDDFTVHHASARSQAQGNSLGPMIAREFGLPSLTPVFPRSESGWQTYTHALDQDCLAIQSGDLYRIDLQLIAMIEDARGRLRERDWTVNEEIILAGFSASGSLANRFSLLHPERVKLVAAGGLNGMLMLPIPELDSHALDYPLGLNDYALLTGREFPSAQWNRLPQFLFMGADDDNDATQYADAYSDAERTVIYAALGETMQPDRWVRCQQAYFAAGANTVFRTYEGVAHGTSSLVHRELLEFVGEVLGGQVRTTK